MFREDSFWLQSIDLDCVSHGIDHLLAEARSVSQVRVRLRRRIHHFPAALLQEMVSDGAFEPSEYPWCVLSAWPQPPLVFQIAEAFDHFFLRDAASRIHHVYYEALS